MATALLSLSRYANEADKELPGLMQRPLTLTRTHTHTHTHQLDHIAGTHAAGPLSAHAKAA